MAKILHNGDWYEQLSTEALYEEEYENLLTAHATDIFPNFKLVKFKKTVYADSDGAKADFALVHEKYREWWVVEAELSHHPFEGHVRPQIEILSRAEYGQEEANYLCNQEPSLDIDRMCSMVKGHQPGVLVIVNAPMPNWTRDLRQYRALVTVLEVFRSRFNRYLYRLNGEQPADIGIQKSQCVVELARMLKLASPGILAIQHGEKMDVMFQGGIMEWSRFDTADGVYLISAKPVSLNSKFFYELVELEDASFVLNITKRK